MPIDLSAPLTEATVRSLKAGDEVRLQGTIYTARDAAHRRICELLDRGEETPLPLEGAIIYYVGPTPGTPDQVLGAAGPTTSYRMDAYAPRLMQMGMRAMLGKGGRSPEVIQAMQECGTVYLAATGGAGALLAKCITAAEVIAYDDLGPEAIRKLTVTDFPAIVAIDAHGKSLF